MSGLRGYSLTQEIDTEIVSAYAAASASVPAVTAAPGWFVMGAFYLPKSVEQCRLDVMAILSAAGLTGSARLWDVTADAPVSGSLVSFTNLVEARTLSGSFALTGARQYLVQIQAVGAVGANKFVNLRTASLVGA